MFLETGEGSEDILHYGVGNNDHNDNDPWNRLIQIVIKGPCFADLITQITQSSTETFSVA
jgi:hypothetical protein